MEKLTRIPIPWSARWRLVRCQVLPALVVAGGAATLVLLWGRLDGGGIAAIAEGVRTAVTCPQSALLQEVTVRPYQWVEAGEVVATVQPVDPRAKLDLLQSELQLARLRMEPSLSDEHALDFERLRVESLRLKQELAVSEVELARAESALRRSTLLRKDRLVSEDAYDLALRDRDRFQSEVNEKRSSLADVDRRLNALRGLGEPEFVGQNHPVAALMTNLDAKLTAAESGWKPIQLRAPISGMVTMVNRGAGEFAVEGEALITINSGKADRIVGYLRQPYVVEPELGMTVELVTRARHRQKFRAEISEIGAQVEVITNALAMVKPFALVDVGLPVVVRVPPGLTIRPGETFDMLFPRDVSAARRQSISPVASAQP